MKAKDKIKKISNILKKVTKEEKIAKIKVTKLGVGINETKKQATKRMKHNLPIYAEALSNIMLIVDGEKEIWAKCPYCNLKFTRVVKDTETKKSFWCESCKK